MVSSYLVCDWCGRFGPPASIFSENGLRLCYSCWYEARRDSEPEAPGAPAPASDANTQPAAKGDAQPPPRPPR